MEVPARSINFNVAISERSVKTNFVKQIDQRNCMAATGAGHVLIGETKQEIRERNEYSILQAAEAVFAKYGFKGASISVIAKAAGMPKSNVTYYFGSKERLYRTLLDDIIKEWLDAALEIETCHDPKTALTSYIHTKMDLARTRPNGSKVWANEIIHGAPFMQDYLETDLADWLDKRSRVLQQWMDEGKIRRLTPQTIFSMIWAVTQHYADFDHQIVTLNGAKALSADQWQTAKNEITEIILSGIGLNA